MPAHFKRLCSAIDAYHPIYTLISRKNPISNFTSSSGLSQSLESHHLWVSGDTGDDESKLLDSQEVTPETSVSQVSGLASFKKPKQR
jgi:hypothetical protein